MFFYMCGKVNVDITSRKRWGKIRSDKVCDEVKWKNKSDKVVGFCIDFTWPHFDMLSHGKEKVAAGL